MLLHAACLAQPPPGEGEAWRHAAPFFDTLPNGATYNADTTALREQLLTGYDKTDAPYSHRTVLDDGAPVTVGTDVELSIKFFKLESITTAEGSMRLHVWVYHSWRDERLRWNPLEHGRVSSLYFSNPYLEEPEIWLPDITTFNARANPDEIYEKAYQQVWWNGDVKWVRPGVLDILCTFSGLVAFPYDRLRCVFEMGGWALSGFHEGINLDNATGGVIFPDGSNTGIAGGVYQEYKVHTTGRTRIHGIRMCVWGGGMG